MSLLYEALRRIQEDKVSKESSGDNGGRGKPDILEAVDESRLNATAKLANRNVFRELEFPAREESRLVFGRDPVGLAVEHYRLLRRRLIGRFPHGAVVMVTSPGKGDGKTVTALNLASCLADLGAPTLLMEADLRQPSLGTTLGCDIEPPGIEAALDGSVEPHKTVRVVNQLHLHVALVVHAPNNPNKLLNGEYLKSVLEWTKSQFRWVVMDTAPTVPAADVAELLPLTDFVLLVVRARSTPRELLQRALEMLIGHKYGTILNEATAYSNPYYRYATRYYTSDRK